ncbi:MAG: flippase-like domain-containing protein [Deltaproteobacteria bacterium]|jgi:glycosyltransferase 2 family protein|nr:flippase-like domain-containing protein [Deltaproteobacteria bacterium]
MKKTFRYIKQIAPWGIAIAIFVYLFQQYPPSKVLDAIRLVNIPAFIAFSISYFLILYLIDAWSMTKVIKRFSHPVKFRDILAGRGVTYLIMILNYAASQAAFGYYLKRKYDIPIFKALGIFLFIVYIDLMWIITLAFIGSLFQKYAVAGVDLGYTIQLITIVAYAGTLIWLAFWRRLPEKLIGRHIRIPIIEGLRKKEAFHIFENAKLSDYLKTALLRMPIHITIILSMYVLFWTFTVEISLVRILGNVPVVFLIGTLPITPGGLGTANAAMVELLSPYISSPIFSDGLITPKEMLFAATLLWMFSNYLLKICTGTVLLKCTSKGLFKPTEELSEEKAEEAAPHLHGNI